MILKVTSLRYLGGHRLWVEFNDGRAGELEWNAGGDGPMVEPLHDAAFFAKVRLNPTWGILEWPNGYDVAPEWLYFLAFASDPAVRRRFWQWSGELQQEATQRT